MLPALPSKTPPELDDLVMKVTANAAALGKGIHPLIQDAIARLMVKVNSYYTNAIEGNPSKLKDIDAALLAAKAARRESAYGPLRLEISADMAAALFPSLA